MMHHISKLKLSIIAILSVLFFMVSMTVKADAATTEVSESSMTATAYVRRSSTGWMYDLSVKDKQVTFGAKTHYLSNYPNTTWMATKKMYVKKSDGVTYLYYYVTNVSGSVHGWIWHGYLKAGASYESLYGVAKAQLGKPYSYGGNGPSAFDCSGLTSYVFKKAMNKPLVRTAQSQYNTYQHVSSSNIKKGDLVFFGSSKSSVTHTGIYIGSGKMLDAQNNGVITEKIAAPWWNLVGYARPATIS